MKKLLAGSLSVLALFAFACSGGSKAAVGVYHLDKEALKKAATDAGSADGAAMFDAMNSTIELKADGTMAMTMKAEMMGRKIDESGTGTWKLDGNKLTMTSDDKKGGKGESKTVDYDNGAFTIDMGTDGPAKMKMTYRRK